MQQFHGRLFLFTQMGDTLGKVDFDRSYPFAAEEYRHC